MTRALGLFFVAMVLAAHAAQASPVLWTMSGVTFDDGAVATGSFVFDADTLAYSEIDIITTAGPVLPGDSYVLMHPLFPPSSHHLTLVADLPLAVGVHAMNLSFSDDLTNAGGVVQLGPFINGIEGNCTSAGCFGVNPFREIAVGELRGTAVPEPAAMALLAAGLASVLSRRGSSPSRP